MSDHTSTIGSTYWPHSLHSTVWIYLFFLPFQLIDQFGWSTIAGVGIASFIYLGFLAAGEEIEQPFGKPISSSCDYKENHTYILPIFRLWRGNYVVILLIQTLIPSRLQNDLDLDSFCQDIIHKDIDQLKGTPCLNSYFTHRASAGVHRSIAETSLKSLNDQQEQEVFGALLWKGAVCECAVGKNCHLYPDSYHGHFACIPFHFPYSLIVIYRMEGYSVFVFTA